MNDLLAFALYYCYRELGAQWSPAQREWCELLQHQRLALAAPRGFGKSTWLAKLSVLHHALTKPGSVQLLLSASSTLAEKWLAWMKLQLEQNTDLIADYGLQQGTIWRAEHIVLTNGSVIYAKGAGSQIRGDRPTRIVVDDIETEELVLNPSLLEEFEHWFQTAVIGTLMPEGVCHVIGTILHPDSFLQRRISNPPPGWVGHVCRAITPGPSNSYEDGTSLWEAKWPLHALLARRDEIGPLAFEQEYQNNPIPLSARKFRPPIPHWTQPLPDPHLTFFTVDVAWKQGMDNDETVIAIGITDTDFNLIVTETHHGKWQPSETIEKLVELTIAHKPVTIGIEDVGGQVLIKEPFIAACRDRGIFPNVVDLKTRGRKKHLRIDALQPRYAANKFFVVPGQATLEHQMIAHPATRGHDDVIDAVAYLLDIIVPASTLHVDPVQPNTMAAFIRTHCRAPSGRVWGNQHVRRR